MPDTNHGAGGQPDKRVDTPLRWLAFIFLLCIGMVFGLRWFFNDLESDLSHRGYNERARLFVGEEIVRGIQGVEKDIYRMAATQNVKGIERIRATVESQLDKLRHDLGVLQNGGTVRLKDGAMSKYSITYDFQPAHWEAFREACKEMAKLQFAAGAKRVLSLHANPVVMEKVEDIGKLDDAPWEPVRVRVLTAHQMGGCGMGKDPFTSVVDPHLKFHTLDNLFVVDGSVLPTALGVNPQETIFGIARWAAAHIGDAVG